MKVFGWDHHLEADPMRIKNHEIIIAINQFIGERWGI